MSADSVRRNVTGARGSGITGTSPNREPRRAMTNRIAIMLGLALLIALAVDYWLYDTEHLVFLAKKFFALLDWMAFWR